MFKTPEEFKNNYLDIIFNNRKTYELELWFSKSGNYTYKITYYEDNLLSTGQVSSPNNIEDYITISRNDSGDRKVSISNFVDKNTIDKSVENDKIKITINKRKQYINFESYTITVENRTDKTIMISEGVNSNDICLIDSNGTEYDSILNETPLADLQIEPYTRKAITIEFNKMYDEYRTIEEMRFKNIIMDKEVYDQNKDSGNIIDVNIAI